MSTVTLVSGGLDSTVMAILAHEEGITQYPLFVDYGQLAHNRELRACRANLRRHGLPGPKVARLRGFGALLPSGLTSRRKRVFEDAFLPCRNLMFLTVASAYASHKGASAVGIGLLDEAFSIFPDQTRAFLLEAQALVSRALGTSISIVAPLMSFAKADVVRLARSKGITDTYSCHAGGARPCGKCVACREYDGLEA